MAKRSNLGTKFLRNQDQSLPPFFHLSFVTWHPCNSNKEALFIQVLVDRIKVLIKLEAQDLDTWRFIGWLTSHHFKILTNRLTPDFRFHANYSKATTARPHGITPLDREDQMNHQPCQELLYNTFKHYANNFPLQ